MRVTGGELRGRTLRVPRGEDVRPTTDMVREAVFSILGPVEGMRVVDLFCGTGALAIEALSRGAEHAVLVDRRTRAARRNVEDLALAERVTLLRGEASRRLRTLEPGAAELVFCDPPYRLADRLGAELEPLIERALAPRGRLVIESSPQRPAAVKLPLLTERVYGDTLIRVHAREEQP